MVRKSLERAAEAALFSPYELLNQLPNPMLVVDVNNLSIRFANSQAESSLGISRRLLESYTLRDLFGTNTQLEKMIEAIRTHSAEVQRQDLQLQAGSTRGDHVVINAHIVVGALESAQNALIEWLALDQQIRSERDARVIQQVEANKTLMRNLAHEIKNPLGGIRGAAQLLEYELSDKGLHEYTRVIVNESDRLQTLVDRLLAPHRKKHVDEMINVHEVLERVRSLVLAEFPNGLVIRRNYDTSLPDILADKEALIQAVLNLVHNAAQILRHQIELSTAVIELKTRVARNVTIGKVRHRLALDLHVIDNGPGIADEIRDKIFFPLVSGTEGGSGLGLTLAQTYIQKHQGVIGCTSEPGRTDFQVQIPYRMKSNQNDLGAI